MHTTLEHCRTALREAIKDMTAANAERGGPDGRWSVAGILEHLDLTYTRNIQGLERRLQKGVPKADAATLRQRVRRLILTRVGYFPTGITSPDAVRPQGRPFLELSIVIEPHLLLLDQRLKDAARAFGARTPVLNHPVLGPFSVNDWRRFHWVHTRHHVAQIKTSAAQPSIQQKQR